MNADELRDVEERLEALESLAKLFGHSWLEYVKSQIQDEKIRAYLTVFDDAFPGIDHVVEFVRQNARALAAGEGVQENFASLAQALLQRQVEGAGLLTSDAEVVGEITAPDDSRADAEKGIQAAPDDTDENIEILRGDEQEDARKPTGDDDEESKNEDQIDALFG